MPYKVEISKIGEFHTACREGWGGGGGEIVRISQSNVTLLASLDQLLVRFL